MKRELLCISILFYINSCLPSVLSRLSFTKILPLPKRPWVCYNINAYMQQTSKGGMQKASDALFIRKKEGKTI